MTVKQGVCAWACWSMLKVLSYMLRRGMQRGDCSRGNCMGIVDVSATLKVYLKQKEQLQPNSSHAAMHLEIKNNSLVGTKHLSGLLTTSCILTCIWWHQSSVFICPSHRHQNEFHWIWHQHESGCVPSTVTNRPRDQRLPAKLHLWPFNLHFSSVFHRRWDQI